MNRELLNKKIKSFKFEGKEQKVSFVETLDVCNGVKCDVYTFHNDTEKDLGRIFIKKGCSTPKQKVISGTRTVEGYLSGKGKLVVERANGLKEKFEVNEKINTPFTVDIGIEDTMQWKADEDSDLTVYEICFPPYKDGRYINLLD